MKNDFKPTLSIGILGIKDHGKSTLTAAILKVLADKGHATSHVWTHALIHDQNLKRDGVKVNAKWVDYETNQGRYRHFDAEDNSDLIKSLLCGIAKIEAAIVVIAANHGPMPGTVEQLLLARRLGVRDMIVFLSKVDLMEEEVLTELTEIDIEGMLEKHSFSIPIIRGSAVHALDDTDAGIRSIEELLSEMDAEFLYHSSDTQQVSVGHHSSFQVDLYVATKAEGGDHQPLFNNEERIFDINGQHMKGRIKLTQNMEMVFSSDHATLAVELEKKLPIAPGQNLKIIEKQKNIAYGVITAVPA